MVEDFVARKEPFDAARGRLVLLVLAAVQFTNIVDFMIVMPLGMRLKEAMAINPAQFGWIVSSYALSASAAGLLASTLVDHFDRKNAFLTLYSGFLVGTLCCGLAPSYPMLLAARVVTGMFGGILGGLAMAIIADVFPEEKRGEATGWLMSAFALATVVGVPLGLVLSNHSGWNAPFLMLAALGLIVLPGGFLALPPLRSHLHQAGHPRAGALAEIKATLSDPNHLRAFALIMTLMFGGFMVITYIATYLETNVGVSKESLPLVYLAGGVLTLFSAPWIGRLADRHGRFPVYRVVAPLAAVLMLVMTHLPRVPLALAIATPAALMVGNAGRMVVAMTMVTSCVEPRRRGGFMSLNSSVQHLSTGLGAAVAGMIVGRDASGALTHYDRVGWIAVASIFVSIALAARLRPYSRRQAFEDPRPRTDVDFRDATAASTPHPPPPSRDASDGRPGCALSVPSIGSERIGVRGRRSMRGRCGSDRSGQQSIGQTSWLGCQTGQSPAARIGQVIDLLADQLGEHGDEPGMGAHGGRTDHGQAEGIAGLPGLFIEVEQDLHVVGEEPDRVNDDRAGPSAVKVAEMVEDIGFEPGVGRPAAPALVNQGPALGADSK